MKKRFELILLDVLWLSAITLFASFWFDLRFGFNIFSAEHWNYLAIQQLSSGRVLPLFYISMVMFIIIGIIGLYFINRPYLRKIDFTIPPETKIPTDIPADPVTPILNPTTQNQTYSQFPLAPILPRPPRIIGPLSSFANTMSAAPVNSTPVLEIIDIDKQLKDIFQGAGYIVKQPPKIAGLKLNLWAVGLDESLYIGIADSHSGEISAIEGGESKWRGATGEFDSPVWKLNQSIEKIRALFLETLDQEIQINIKAFVVMNNANITNRNTLEKIWNAFGVEVFDSTNSLTEFMNNNKNREIAPEEQEDFDAYSDYIDTVANYFNKT